MLDSAFRDLRYEIADTDNTTYKAGLRSREAVLSSILSMLGGPLPDPSVTSPAPAGTASVCYDGRP